MRSLDEVRQFNPHKELREIQEMAIETAYEIVKTKPKKKFIILELPPGCHAKGTKILMYNGEYKNVEDVEVGDRVMGSDSNSKTVANLCRGRDEMYKVIPRKGVSFIVNSKHILSLKRTPTVSVWKGKKYCYAGDVVNISVEDYLNKANNFKSRYKLYKNQIYFNTVGVDYVIPPYILGLWLGDGSSAGTALTSMDAPIVSEWERFAKDNGMYIRKYLKDPSNKASTYYITSKIRGGDFRNTNPVLSMFRGLGLINNKHVPKIYKTGSEKIRLEVLAGMIDTDGSLSCNGYEVTQKNKILFDDIVFIAQSLGFGVSQSIRRIHNVDYYRCHITGHTSRIPVRLRRKKAGIRKQRKNVLVMGFSIEKIGRGNYYGFTVDGDHLYVMQDFFITHNSGKSAAGWMLAHMFNTGYFITIQKLLQDQYVEEMGDKMAILKGQNAYTCATHPEYTCENSVCVAKKKIRQAHTDVCPYVMAVDDALTRDYSLFNIHSFYFQYNYGKFGGQKRDMVVVDEGHLIENAFMSIISASITEDNKTILDIPRYEKTADYLEYIDDVRKGISRELGEYEDVDENTVTADIAKRITRLVRTKRKLDILYSDLNSKEEWVHMMETLGDGRKRLVFKPVFVNRFIKDTLYDAASERVLIMSATIGDFSQFCRSAGIPKEEATIIRGPSPFPVENRKVFYEGSGKMSRKYFKKTWPRFIKALRDILDDHEGERGIVHTHANWLAEKILKELDMKRLTPKRGDVYAMLEEHKQKKDSVIVAAGLGNGLDLKDQLARFQVLCKVPYSDISDPQVARRKELSPEYYAYTAVIEIMQMYGRVVRSEEDWAKTYITDGDFPWFKSQNKEMFSDWFLEAIQKNEN